jgi:hypothetical protein
VVVMTQWRDGSRTEKEGLGQEKLRWRSGSGGSGQCDVMAGSNGI